MHKFEWLFSRHYWHFALPIPIIPAEVVFCHPVYMIHQSSHGIPECQHTPQCNSFYTQAFWTVQNPAFHFQLYYLITSRCIYRLLKLHSYLQMEEKKIKYDFISITFLHPEYQTDGNNYRWECISYTRSQMLHSSPTEIWNEALNEFSLSRTKLVKKSRGIWPKNYIFLWLPWEYCNSNILIIQLCPHRSFGFFLLPMDNQGTN